jgi:hypothetical protein
VAEQNDKAAKQTELRFDTSPAASEDEKPSGDGEVLEWVCHPVRRRPLVSVAVTAFIVLVGVVVYLASSSNAITVLALVVLLVSLAKFYFPTVYQLNEKGVIVKTTTQKIFKEWSMYRSCYPDKNGILLSPFARPTRLENFRGLYVMFAGNAEQVTAFVKKRIGSKDSPPATDETSGQGSKEPDRNGGREP